MTLEDLVRDAYGDVTLAHRRLGENHPALVHILDAEDRLLEASSILGGSLRRGSDRVTVRLEADFLVRILRLVDEDPAYSCVSDVVRTALCQFLPGHNPLEPQHEPHS